MWLKKLESGELDDKDDWRKKDPSLLTARQRAMLHGPNLDEEEKLVQLPSGYKTQEMTEEMIQRKAQKAKKRRQQAQKKIEENKKQTIDRLLKKQETKQKGTRGRPRRKPDIPKITYVNKLHSVSISLPAGVDFPLKRQTLVEGCFVNPNPRVMGKPGLSLYITAYDTMGVCTNSQQSLACQLLYISGSVAYVWAFNTKTKFSTINVVKPIDGAERDDA
uniref:INO80 complex subunit B-like n=1 Tax=Saccoglossus kowalevskii TaxID=10224 RepID=A0ABM0GIE0_SACKO|nr:PREDICTED: INO80 complex subunit B-like [Saccoglossus kowalevskii]